MQKKLSEEQERILKEIRDLSKKADESSSHQMDLFKNKKFDDDDIDIGFDASIFSDMANPEKSYKLYYAIRRLLMDNLPQGNQNKKLRQIVYDEKNIFLNRGKDKNEAGIRGSDGKMTFINNFLEVAFDIVAKWVSAGGNAFDIYTAFWDLNEEREYHKKSPEKNITSFDQTLKGVLSVPPEKK